MLVNHTDFFPVSYIRNQKSLQKIFLSLEERDNETLSGAEKAEFLQSTFVLRLERCRHWTYRTKMKNFPIHEEN